MKHSFIIILSLLYFGLGSHANAQCPEGIFLVRQGQVDSFSINYPNCHQVIDLFISLSGNINNFKALKVLKGHQKSIGILAYGKENITFEGFENIDSIDYLGITQSNNTIGLSGVTFIDYIFFQNESHFDLSGLSSLNQINTCHIIAPSAEAAISFDLLQFPKVKIIDKLSLNGNFMLNGVENIDSIRSLSINSNYVLKNLDALSNRTSLSRLLLGSVWTDFTFSGVEKIRELDMLYIRNGKQILSLDGLKNMSRIEYLSFENIKEFVPENLTELKSIKDIKGLYIQNVTGLKSLDGFPPSDTLHELFLLKNKSLSNISALNNVKNIGFRDFKYQLENGIEISDNPNLSECSMIPVCDMLRSFPDSIKVIKSNGPKCIDEAEVLSHCISSLDFSTADVKTMFFPNPTFGQITMTKDISIYQITNAQGLIVSIPSSNNKNMDFSAHPSGLYFIHYTNNVNNMPGIEKVIKL